MRGRLLTLAAGLALACALAAVAPADAAAQGRGRGGGGGMGRPAGVGVERGIGRSSERSVGRADVGRGNASERSGGRSDAGLERARLRGENARRADDELREHPQMPARLHTTANDLREGYRAALAVNPELKFGQYVAATRVAANLGRRHPGVTREALLEGLADGRSLGRTLQDLGLNSREAREAERAAERELKESKRRN